jgi:hypothetical protein
MVGGGEGDAEQATGWRGKPFTDEEIEAYLERGGAITICPMPVQKMPELPWTEIQTGMMRDFHPAPYAVETCLDHLKTIKATSRRDMHIVNRAAAIIKGVLQGLPVNDAAKEMGLDPGFVSKTLRNVYKRYPELKAALLLLKSLNLKAKRREQTIFWAVSPIHERPFVASPVFEEWVAIGELRYKAFPEPRSNYSFMVEHVLTMSPGGEWEELQSPISTGTWRRAKTGHDKWGQELDTFDARAQISHRVDLDRLGALDAWYRLRILIGRFMSLCGPIKGAHGTMLAIARLFCLLEALRDTADLPQSMSRPPVPPEARLIRIVPAPYLEHVNECDPPAKIGGPNKYQRAKGLHQRRSTIQQRFATGVFNHGDDTANDRYQRMFPESPKMGGKAIVMLRPDYVYAPPAQREMIEFAPHRCIGKKCQAVLREPRRVFVEPIVEQPPANRAMSPRKPYVPKEPVLNSDGTPNEYCRAIDMYLTDQMSLTEMFARMSQRNREQYP